MSRLLLCILCQLIVTINSDNLLQIHRDHQSKNYEIQNNRHPRQSDLYLMNKKKRDFNNENFMLPKTTRPINYKLWIKSNIDQGILKYQGKTSIELEVLEATNAIVLHAMYLQIETIKLVNVDGREIVIESHDYDLYLEFLMIYTKTQLEPTNIFNLTIEYTADISLYFQTGFFATSYQNLKNEEV